MKINDVFNFTAPNGVEVTAVVIGRIYQNCAQSTFICYGQNRIFTCIEEDCKKDEKTNTWLKVLSYGQVIAEHAVLSDYDELLKTETDQQQFDEECYEALSSIGDVDFNY